MHNLVGGLAGNLVAAVGAVRLADRSVQKAKIVVDFGDGADRRTGAAAGGLLLDGNAGAEAVNAVDVGALHLVEELAGVGGKGLDVAALAFGVNRVKSQ